MATDYNVNSAERSLPKMANWSSCDIRLLIIVIFTLACLLVGITHALYKVHDRLKNLEKLFTNFPDNQNKFPDSDCRQYNEKE